MANNAQEQLFRKALEEFKKGLRKRDQENFKAITFRELERDIYELQNLQHSLRQLKDLNRLQSFLVATKQCGEVLSVFCDANDIMAYIWGPTKFLLQETSKQINAFDELLDTYDCVGNSIPLLLQHKAMFETNPHMVRLLSLIYEDILKFHSITLRYFQQREWIKLFDYTWDTCKSRCSSIVDNIARHRSLIEAQAGSSDQTNYSHPEIPHNSYQTDYPRLESELNDEDLHRLWTVNNWLRAANVEDDQNRFSKTRAEYPGTGEWLLENKYFKEWFDPQYPAIPPLLWLNGIPGAGKTILASLIVERSRQLKSKPTVLFFYCKYENPQRDNFFALARSIVAQLLKQDLGLLPYFHRKYCDSGEAVLTSLAVVEEFLALALGNCRNAYIILDGLDECPRGERKIITDWFKKLVEDLPSREPDRIRCLFVSQDDGVGRRDFSGLASIRIKNENIGDISEYSRTEADKLKRVFQLSDEKVNSIASTVTDSTGGTIGIFLLAKLIWANLLGQTSVARLEEELEPNIFPKEIYDAYQRIMVRIQQQTTRTAMEDTVSLLGWLVCAKRPLKWNEIQGMKSIDLDNQSVDFERQKFVVSAKDLCESLVETQPDGSVEFVHLTAKFFLVEREYIDPSAQELKLACLCIDYLNLPAFVEPPTEARVLNGDYAFMDYAVLYWVRHLEAGSVQPESHEKLMEQLAESLDIFVNLHWNFPDTVFQVSNRVSKKLQFFKDMPFHYKVEQAVVSSNKQLRFFGNMKKGEMALKLTNTVENVRKVLEGILLMGTSIQGIEQKYGKDLYKCPRFSCQFFTTGFRSADDRDKHIEKHERPFRCMHEACTRFILGFSTEIAQKVHMKERHPTIDTQHGEFPTDKEVQDSLPDIPIEGVPEEGPMQPSESEPEAEPPYYPPQKRPKTTTFQCEHCSKVFSKRYNLESHLVTHGAEQPYGCDVCRKRFSRVGDLRRHRKTHTGEKGHACHGCGRTFSRADTLNNHYKSETGQRCLQLEREKGIEHS